MLAKYSTKDSKHNEPMWCVVNASKTDFFQDEMQPLQTGIYKAKGLLWSIDQYAFMRNKAESTWMVSFHSHRPSES